MEFLEGFWLYGILFLVLITIIVFVHEMGHFLVARWCGVRVEVFSVGFGPEIVGWTDRHDTRWKISMIPLGGYVKMFGEMLVAESETDAAGTPLLPEESEVSFHTKRLGQRTAIVAAGPIANFLLAIVVFALLFSTYGQPHTTPKVDSVLPDSAAARAGLQPGDEFKVIGGKTIERFEDVQRIISLRPNVPLEIVVLRDGRRVVLGATPSLVELKDASGNIHRIGRLGVQGFAKERVRYDPFTAIWRASNETLDLTLTTLTAIGQMISGTRPATEIGGPLRIGKLLGDLAQRDLASLIGFMAYISINLGLINLFPIPMLDGGYLLFYMVEVVRGKPLGARAQENGLRLGLALVVTLMVFATWNDLVYLRVIDFIKQVMT